MKKPYRSGDRVVALVANKWIPGFVARTDSFWIYVRAERWEGVNVPFKPEQVRHEEDHAREILLS